MFFFNVIILVFCFKLLGCRIGAIIEIGDKSPKKKQSKNTAAEKLWNRKDELLQQKDNLAMEVDGVSIHKLIIIHYFLIPLFKNSVYYSPLCYYFSHLPNF